MVTTNLQSLAFFIRVSLVQDSLQVSAELVEADCYIAVTSTAHCEMPGFFTLPSFYRIVRKRHRHLIRSSCMCLFCYRIISVFSEIMYPLYSEGIEMHGADGE